MMPRLVIPLIWWSIAQVLGLLAGWFTGCEGGWTELCRSRWDSALYMDIAQHGHTLFECPELPGKWCGNAGWAPLYPLFIFVLSKTGLSMAVAGMAISELFYLALLLLAAKMADVRQYNLAAFVAVGLAAFAPGSIYFQVIFPCSMGVFFLSLTYYFLLKERFWACGISAFFAVIAHSIGFILISVLCIWLAFEWCYRRKLLVKHVFALIAPPIAGVGLWFLYDFLATGHWNALFMVQGKYGHGLNSPLKMLGLHIDNLMKTGFSMELWVEIQNLLITAFVLLAVVVGIRKRHSTEHRLHGIWMAFFWLFPLSVSMQVSLHRNCSNLLPGWLVFSGIRMRTALLLLFILMWWPLAVLFFQSRII